jgi:hypothetical protein
MRRAQFSDAKGQIMSNTKATIRWQAVKDVMLCVHGEEPPTSDEWRAFVRGCDALGSSKGMRVLLVLANVSLSAVQRGDAADTLKRNQVKLAAIVTASRLTRGVVTAIGWVTGVNRAYSPAELSLALDEVRVDGQTREELRRLAREFAVELGVGEAFFGSRAATMSASDS